MGVFDKIKGCEILKDDSISFKEIEELKAILSTCSPEHKKDLEQTIRNLEYGIKGEQAILFELKNSGFPMLVLQDLYLEFEGLSGQIDFLVITRYLNYIIECKNMYGDILVTDTGEFMRKINGVSHKIYSPVTQCERHVQLVRQIRYNEKKNILTKALFNKFGSHGYVPLVVMANPTGKINTRYAPKDVRNHIIGIDQLVRTIRKNHDPKEEGFEKDAIDLAQFFLNAHKQNPQNYMEKYRSYKTSAQQTSPTSPTETQSSSQNTPVICTRCGGTMVLRTAKRGNNIGEEFYGCSSYPKCRNIISK